MDMLATSELIAEAGVEDRLSAVLPRYVESTPLYRAQALPSLAGAESRGFEYLKRFPLITKQDIRRDFPKNFLPDEAALDRLLERDELEVEQTSGTSEERISLLLPRGWWAQQESRALRLNPAVAGLLAHEPQARRVTICSPVCSGDICYTGVPERHERVVGNALFVALSKQPFLWSEADLARIAAETLEWQPRFLDVDPVYGVVFARYCERQGIRLPSLRFILCSYEFVSVAHRRILHRAFGVPVYDLYGSTETGHLLMEDDRGEMRPSLETALFEVVEPDPQGVGDLVVTTLTNDFMPLLRYRIGDLVERRELPYRTRYILHGRAGDAFHTGSGRRVTIRQLDQCLGQFDGFAHYQLLERAEGPWLLRYAVDGTGPESSALRLVEARLVELLGLKSGLRFEASDLLMPESSGKFRLGYPARVTRGPLQSPARESVAACK